jgi:hypothetical protein
MQHKFLLLILSACLLSCSTSTQKISDESNLPDSSDVTEGQTQTRLDVQDSSNYSAVFIAELRGANYDQPIKLMTNYMLVEHDTVTFPDELKLNQATVFKAKKDNKEYELTLTRVNNTTLKFNFRLTDNKSQPIHSESGDAVLSALFFMGSETDEDNDETYDCYEYIKNTNDCSFIIRLGAGTDVNGKLRATLIYGCADQSKPALTLDECPILRTE